VHAPELFGPPRVRIREPQPGPSDESVMEVGDRGGVPGVTGQGAGEETALIVDNVGNDHLNDFLWESYGRGQLCSRDVVRSIRRPRSSDLVPTSLDE
jgi:hypothetical protein